MVVFRQLERGADDRRLDPARAQLAGEVIRVLAGRVVLQRGVDFRSPALSLGKGPRRQARMVGKSDPGRLVAHADGDPAVGTRAAIDPVWNEPRMSVPAGTR
jgi:hypothetical protein